MSENHDNDGVNDLEYLTSQYCYGWNMFKRWFTYEDKYWEFLEMFQQNKNFRMTVVLKDLG